MHRLIPLQELRSGVPQRVQRNGCDLLLCRVGDEVYAVHDTCTHEEISLSLGALCDYRLRCPLHGSEFDIRSGRVLNEPAETDLATFPVSVVDGWVCLDGDGQT